MEPAGVADTSPHWDAIKDRLPSMLAGALMPFQREGIAFCVRNNMRCLIGDEMGLGKTVQV